MANETSTTEQTEERSEPGDGQQAGSGRRQSRVVTNPSDVAGLVLAQLDAVSAKKDELTIAIRNLMETTRQLVRAYAGHAYTIGSRKE